jgi:CDP-diacylglycerol--serine O-phosphatidyltransferase
MASTRFFRYFAPNAITLSSMLFGLVSLWATSHGNYPLAAWMVIYAVLTDRMDGIVARAVKGTSELGMQLDSFADFLNFGISPAFLVLTYLSTRPDMPYADGTLHYLLFASCGVYMLCAVFRLARYNVLSDDQVPTKIFFGFPTTLAGGMMAIWILLLLKYDPTMPTFGGVKLFGSSLHTPSWVWLYWPIIVAVLGYLMASRIPMPKVGMTKNKVVSMIFLILITMGYICGFLMVYPELCFWMPTVWSVAFLIWGQTSSTARAMKPPPLFPKQAEHALVRPQEDMVDIVLDEANGAPSDAPEAPTVPSKPPTAAAAAAPAPKPAK